MDICSTIAAFLTHVRVERGLSANTVTAYRRDLLKFDDFAKKRKLTLESVSRDNLVEFLASLYRQKLESRTVARHLVTLRNFFRFAQLQELISTDPSLNLESPKIRRSSAWLSATRRNRAPAGTARRQDATGPARSRDAGRALFHRPARL